MTDSHERFEGPDADGAEEALDRRDFFGLAALAAAGGMLSPRVMAGPFARRQGKALIPRDKKLDAAWLRSLYARGVPAWYRGEDLQRIGMPVGGICAGQVYLSGDGRLWLWDVFNENAARGRRGQHYVKPLRADAPQALLQGFAIELKSAAGTQRRHLDRRGFEDVRFLGEYPIGRVQFADPGSPVGIELEAFSPFVPLDVEASSLPATLMRYTIRNESDTAVQVRLLGYLENAVCKNSGRELALRRENRVQRGPGLTLIQCRARGPSTDAEPRADIGFADFETETWEGWTQAGTAFGEGPIAKADMPDYQGEVGAHGKRLVNSHNARHGEDVRGADAHRGSLTSAPFEIRRDYISMLLGGGAHPGKTCVNLLIEGKVVASLTGRNRNHMDRRDLFVRPWIGKRARLQIRDDFSGGWGNIGVDDILFCDRPKGKGGKLEQRADFGRMALALLEAEEGDAAQASVPAPDAAGGLEALFEACFAGRDTSAKEVANEVATATYPRPLLGAVGRRFELAAGEKRTVTFTLAWYFPNLHLARVRSSGRHYATRFASASAVIAHVQAHLATLVASTRLWRDTWYDSSLPRWFLDRTFANASTLATTTVHRFADGRFYGWEGIGCCAGTCTHVWHYAQAPARLFPELERDLRERVDFGLAFDEKTGRIAYRGEFHEHAAHDGQAGSILRAYREHRGSADGAFLRRNWAHIKAALGWLIARDGDGDGIIEGPQPNTLDASWYGKIAWLTSLYLAALRAGELMAREVGDRAFAAKVRPILERGGKRIVSLLWDEELGYFVQIPDPKHEEAIGSGRGCYIDQVFGQSWAFQNGMGRLYDEDKIRSALRALWTFNFAPDVGPYRKAHPRGRPYALAGDAGLIMCTWPKGGRKKGQEKHWQFGYFNECMSGFEYEVAGHMLWEGMLTEGLAIARSIHDRYHPSRRNPYNEIECGDHYARAMASYGVFLAACGFEYHGPHGRLSFAPRLGPEDFRAAFTAAEGWGTISQHREGASQRNAILLRRGRLRLAELAFELAGPARAVTVTHRGRTLAATHQLAGKRLRLRLEQEITLEAGDELVVTVG